MKGIILAGGSGTRLYPSTKCISKQMLPIYDKPMIYYPLTVLMEAQIREILIISSRRDILFFRDLFGDGNDIGISLSYAEQSVPRGVAEALVIGESFIGNDPVCLILGDNLFYGGAQKATFPILSLRDNWANVFAVHVDIPQHYGVITFDSFFRPVAIEEKPPKPKSNYAVPGLYYYGAGASYHAKKLEASYRGEFEITDLNRWYLSQGRLSVHVLNDIAWFDVGTPDRLLEAAEFIKEKQSKLNKILFCPEEVAWKNGWITREQMRSIGLARNNSSYGRYLLSLAEGYQ